MLSLLVYMLFYMFYKSMLEKKYGRWRVISDQLIQNTIFSEMEDASADAKVPVPAGTGELIKDKHFRKLLVNEIMSAKRNISGAASASLNQLYKQMGLDKYALKGLRSHKWHVKAKAIQELTVMEMTDFVNQLHLFTNDHNDLVRMEAQSALVQFNGFEGLSFLDAITHPLSDWQQIKLLQKLSLKPVVNIDMDNWFKSGNRSVVIFTLKLARNYHRYDLHDAIVSCLDHEDPAVRLEAINCLSEINIYDTSDRLIERFLGETIKNQLAMIKAMQNIGTERDILFLLDLLDFSNDEMRLHAARALAHNSNKNALQSLEEHARKAGFPLSAIVMQIKGELAA
jgi:hypothetical protein